MQKAGKKIKIFLSVLFIFTLFLSVFAPLPAHAAYQPGFETRSEAVLLYSIDSKAVVFEKNAAKRMEPASLTKIITALVTMEQIPDLKNTKITAKQKILDDLFGTGSSNAGILSGETLTAWDLLHCILIQSANEAAAMLADYIGDGDPAMFYQMMNAKAKELGAENTHFANASGLPQEGHYTTCQDMLRITLYAMEQPGFMDIVNLTRYQLPETNKQKARWLSTTNLMISSALGGSYYMAGVEGIKTGRTQSAGNCFISSAKRNGYHYLLISMGAPDRDADQKKLPNGAFLDAKELYKWAFDTFRVKPVVKLDEPVHQIKVNLSWDTDSLLLIPEGTFSALIPKEIESTSIQIVPDVPDSVDAPVNKGQVIGTASLRLAGEEIGKINLISGEEIARSQFLYLGKIISKGWVWFLLVVAILALLIGAYFVMGVIHNRRRRRMKQIKPRRRF